MADVTPDIDRSSGSGPTDAYQAMNALLMRVLLLVAERSEDRLPGLTATLKNDVLLITGAAASRVYGRFTPLAWQHGDRAVHEIFVDADFDNHQPGISSGEHVLVTLAHEAVHAYAEVTGIDDCSPRGWHNRRFAELAFQIGLWVDADARVGHRTRRINLRGKRDYTDLIDMLDRGLDLVRRPRAAQLNESNTEDVAGLVDTLSEGKVSTTMHVVATCQCLTDRGRVTIRVARGSWRAGVVQCSACGSVFEESLTTNDRADRTNSTAGAVGDAT